MTRMGAVKEVRSGQASGETRRGLIELGRIRCGEWMREREESRIPFRYLNLSNRMNDGSPSMKWEQS